MGEIKQAEIRQELEKAIDLFSNEFGDIETVNLINYWLIKKLGKRMELYDVHR